MLRAIYRIYKNHIADEVNQLQTTRGYSMTWAVEEARYLVHSLHGSAVSRYLLNDELKKLEVLPIEDDSRRYAMSSEDLGGLEFFWTIECTLLQPAEHLIREAKTQASLSHIVKALGLSDFELPKGHVLCGIKPSSSFGDFAYMHREVDMVEVNVFQRRIDLRWAKKNDVPRWQSFPLPLSENLHGILSDRNRAEASITSIFVGCHNIPIKGNPGDFIATSDNIFILPDTAVAQYLSPQLVELNKTPENTELSLVVAFQLHIVLICLGFNGRVSGVDRIIKRELTIWQNHLGKPLDIDHLMGKLLLVISDVHWEVFAPSKWSRPINGHEA